MAAKEITKIRVWKTTAEIVVFILALAAFVYSGKFLMAHQMDV